MPSDVSRGEAVASVINVIGIEAVLPDEYVGDAFCKGCGYYRATRGEHRADCTATR